ncbi:MAG: TetR/AcrR family transcriptional regulator [Deltaproteobacteria bacterium]|nr:TetR/AcrR family transcriptional regulator [Deltaproteobacteria bacterium]
MPRAKSITDAALLDIALEVIRRQGPERFTLADVSRAASLSPATLIQRFGSKATMVERALARNNHQLSETVAAPVTPGPHARAQLVEWLVQLAQPLRTRRLIAAHLPVLRRDLLDPSIRRHARRHGVLMREGIGRHLAAIDPQCAPATVETNAALIEAQWHGLVIQWAISGDRSFERWLRHGLQTLLQLVLDR